MVSLIKRRWICCLSSIFWHWCRIFGNYNPSNSPMGWTFGRIYISLLAAIRQIRSGFCVLKLSLTKETYTNKSWVIWQNFNSWMTKLTQSPILPNDTIHKTCSFYNFVLHLVGHRLERAYFPNYLNKNHCLILCNGTLLRKVNGSSGFFKGPRTSKVWKSKDPKISTTVQIIQKVWSSIFFFPVSLLLRFWILSRNADCWL